jgi:hypothetical protein
MERTGSIKRKIVSPDLKEERDNSNFDKEEMKVLLFGSKKMLDTYESWIKDMESDPILRPTEKFYEMTREEQL